MSKWISNNLPNREMSDSRSHILEAAFHDWPSTDQLSLLAIELSESSARRQDSKCYTVHVGGQASFEIINCEGRDWIQPIPKQEDLRPYGLNCIDQTRCCQ